MTLRNRLIFGLAGLVLFAIVSSGWALLTVARNRLEGAQETQARLVSEQILRVLRAAYDPTLALNNPTNRTSLGGTVAALVERGDVRELVLVDDQRRLVAGRDTGAIDWDTYGRSETVVVRQFPAIYVYAPLVGFERQFVGWARMRLAGDDAIASAMSRFWFLLLAIALLDGTFVVLFGARFLRSVVEPVEALSRTSLQVAGGNLDVAPVAIPASGDELARLVESFNQMITSLRTQQNHLLAQEKLATVGLLAAGVAHEIGNPLAASTAYMDLLSGEGFSFSDDEKKDAIVRTRKELERIRTIVQELLDYARPVSEQFEPVKLSELFRTCISLVGHQIRFRAGHIVVNCADSDAQVRANGSRLTQVLVNLLLNAADAMNGQGTIEITAVTLDDAAEIRVIDSGPGVPLSDRERIFDPFFTTKEPGQGTGLGLAISRSIVQAYHGSLMVEESAQGATFLIRLPIWKNPEPVEGVVGL